MGYTPFYSSNGDPNNILENIFGGYISFDEDYPGYCKKFVFFFIANEPDKKDNDRSNQA